MGKITLNHQLQLEIAACSSRKNKFNQVSITNCLNLMIKQIVSKSIDFGSNILFFRICTYNNIKDLQNSKMFASLINHTNPPIDHFYITI